MDNTIRFDTVRNAFHELSKSHKRITLEQVIEQSGVNNPEHEIEVLRKKGIIIQVEPNEFMWV